jgi:hypothetical protein
METIVAFPAENAFVWAGGAWAKKRSLQKLPPISKRPQEGGVCLKSIVHTAAASLTGDAVQNGCVLLSRVWGWGEG